MIGYYLSIQGKPAQNLLLMEIGEVVWIQARIGDLFLPERQSLINYSGFWGVINQIYDPYHYAVLLYSGMIFRQSR